jgi:flagellin-like protein
MRVMRSVRGWHRRGRAVSSIIAVVLLLALTVAAGALLWAYRPPLPPTPVTITYQAVGDQSEPAWGDPTDCTNTSIHAQCNALPAFFIVFTSHSPTAIPLSSLQFDFRCNGTSLVNGSFSKMEVVPGTGQNPNSGSPKLGHCGTWSPSTFGNQATYFNRLAFFEQVSVGAKGLNNGDVFVVYVHPAADFCDRSGYCPDDDFHGAPPWCFTIVGACEVLITYTSSPSALVATIPVSELSA